TAEAGDHRRRGMREPDARRGELRPCRVAAHVGSRPVRDRNRASLFVVDGDDPAHRLCFADHRHFRMFGGLSKTAPIMTKAIKLTPLRLVQPCQLPSCTTTSPAFITTVPRSSSKVRSPSSRMP